VAYASWEASVTEDSTKAEAMPLYNIVHLANNYCFLEVIFENDCAFIIPLINNDMPSRAGAIWVLKFRDKE
jgi:hypothetical protein